MNINMLCTSKVTISPKCINFLPILCSNVFSKYILVKNGTNRDAVWVEDLSEPKEPCIRWGSTSPMGKGNFEEGKGCPILNYRDTLWSPVRKRLNRPRCRLRSGLGWAQDGC